jgi:hypothetical protein
MGVPSAHCSFFYPPLGGLRPTSRSASASAHFTSPEGPYILEQIAERYTVVMHSLSLSIGSTDPLNFEYPEKLGENAKRSCYIQADLCPTKVRLRSNRCGMALSFLRN